VSRVQLAAFLAAVVLVASIVSVELADAVRVPVVIAEHGHRAGLRGAADVGGHGRLLGLAVGRQIAGEQDQVDVVDPRRSSRSSGSSGSSRPRAPRGPLSRRDRVDLAVDGEELERLGLDLAHALAADTQRAADRLE
jgi:hypothetical protein